MSVQTVAKNKDEVAAIVQNFINQGCCEFLIAERADEKTWSITGDRKKFWSWLLTPQEAEELQKENERIRELARQIQESYDAYVENKGIDDEYSQEQLHQINLYVKKLLL